MNTPTNSENEFSGVIYFAGEYHSVGYGNTSRIGSASRLFSGSSTIKNTSLTFWIGRIGAMCSREIRATDGYLIPD